jgi:hypothetical protein
MMMEMDQQHVSYETGDEPGRCFHDSLESGRHEARIPHSAFASRAEL